MIGVERPEWLPGSVAWRAYTASDKLAESLAQIVARELRKAIQERHSASLMLSGGSTPIPFLQTLSKQHLDWSKLIVGLVDERVVSPDHSDSNENLIREHLIARCESPPKFVGMVQDYRGEHESWRSYVEQAQRNYTAIPQPFDVTILGMGKDGHTASMFPYASELDYALNSEDLVTGLLPKTAPYQRLTLTRKAIQSSRQIIMHITGMEKLGVLKEAVTKKANNLLPVSYILGGNLPITVFWSP